MSLYTTTMGSWGDAIAAYGNSVQLSIEHGHSFSMIYYGFDDTIVEFLKLQDYVEKVVHVKPADENEFFRVVKIAGEKKLDWNKLAKVEGEVVQTHIGNDYLFDHPERCFRNFSMKLPKGRGKCEKDCLLFQPFSTNSVSPIDHWPFWFNALEWIVDNTKWDITVIGQRTGGMRGQGFIFPDMEFPGRVKNKVGKTKSMLEIFSMANRCKGIITTSNCLSMWSVISKTPALVICNKLNLTHDYYNGWINHPPNTLLGVNICFETFKKRFREWEKTL